MLQTNGIFFFSTPSQTFVLRDSLSFAALPALAPAGFSPCSFLPPPLILASLLGFFPLACIFRFPSNNPFSNISFPDKLVLFDFWTFFASVSVRSSLLLPLFFFGLDDQKSFRPKIIPKGASSFPLVLSPLQVYSKTVLSAPPYPQSIRKKRDLRRLTSSNSPVDAEPLRRGTPRVSSPRRNDGQPEYPGLDRFGLSLCVSLCFYP